MATGNLIAAISLKSIAGDPIETFEQRDAKGFYRRARAGDIKSFTGIFLL
jgi:hypothetical protein